jgi:hypothetical protein
MSVLLLFPRRVPPGPYDGIPDLVHVYEPARRALSRYAGPLLRLRRDSDDAESDFRPVATTGDLDTAAIAAWLGAAAGYVVTVYDQKGGAHLTQATTTRQPLFTANAENGHAGMTLNADAAMVATFPSTLAQPNTIYAVARATLASVQDDTVRYLCDGLTIDGRASFYKQGTAKLWAMHGGTIRPGLAVDANLNIWAGHFNGATSQFWINTVSQVTGNAGTHSMAGLVVGGVYTASPTWIGTALAFVVCNTLHSTAEREALQTAFNAYWGAY